MEKAEPPLGGNTFDIDVFISYAHDDDNTLMDERVGWVSQFHDDFDKLLNEQLGRKPSIWRDSDLTPNEEFEKKIFNRLTKSAVLLPVLSRIFLKRPYCLRELKAFVENARQRNATYVDGADGERKRIFVVEKIQVDRQHYPDELQGLAGTFKFYHEGSQTLRPALSSRDSQAREAYYRVMNRLSKTVADLIQLMERVDRAAGVEALPGPGLPVFVAETTWDLEEQREALCDDLRDRGYLVLPDRELPRHVKRYSEAVTGYLQTAVLSVHLIGHEYGFVPEGEQELSHVRLQHSLALAKSDADPKFAQIVWLPGAAEAPADGRQRHFIDYLRADERANSHAELLDGDIETLKTELYDKLDRIRAAQEAAAPRAPSTPAARETDGPPVVYLICNKADRTAEHLKALRRLFFERGCEPRLPSEGAGEADALKAHLDRLALCDAFLIYHGSGSEDWLEDRLMEFHEHLRGRAKKVLAKAVYVAPPRRPDKDDVITHEASIVEAGESFAPDLLEPFLAALRPAAHG